jgi:hypothetical protein
MGVLSRRKLMFFNSSQASGLMRALDYRDQPSAAQRVVNVTTSTLTIDPELHDSKVLTINRAAGCTITLPAATGSGLTFTVFCGTTVTSNAILIQAAGSDALRGQALVTQDAADTVVGFEAGGVDDFSWNGTTTGGIVGDTVTYTDVASGVWMVKAIQSGTGTEATPFV